MEKPQVKAAKKTLDYLEMTKYIEEKYNIKVRDYHKTYDKSKPDYEGYMDYWHFVVDYSFPELRNDTYQYFDIKSILDDPSIKPWIKEITQLFYDEFKEDLDSDGGMEVWISW